MNRRGPAHRGRKHPTSTALAPPSQGVGPDPARAATLQQYSPESDDHARALSCRSSGTRQLPCTWPRGSTRPPARSRRCPAIPGPRCTRQAIHPRHPGSRTCRGEPARRKRPTRNSTPPPGALRTQRLRDRDVCRQPRIGAIGSPVLRQAGAHQEVDFLRCRRAQPCALERPMQQGLPEPAPQQSPCSAAQRPGVYQIGEV